MATPPNRCPTGFVAWYRNPASATPASLQIAYEKEEGEWASLQPDFIVVSRRSDGGLGASIVDPHGDYLADARATLQALATLGERHADRFVRIESIAKVDDGTLRVLDLDAGRRDRQSRVSWRRAASLAGIGSACRWTIFHWPFSRRKMVVTRSS